MDLSKQLFIAGIILVILSVVLPAIAPIGEKGANKLSDLGNTLVSIAAGMALPATINTSLIKKNKDEDKS